MQRIVLPNDTNVCVQLWDIGGQSIGSKMITNYIHGAHAVRRTTFPARSFCLLRFIWPKCSMCIDIVYMLRMCRLLRLPQGAALLRYYKLPDIPRPWRLVAIGTKELRKGKEFTVSKTLDYWVRCWNGITLRTHFSRNRLDLGFVSPFACMNLPCVLMGDIRYVALIANKMDLAHMRQVRASCRRLLTSQCNCFPSSCWYVQSIRYGLLVDMSIFTVVE